MSTVSLSKVADATVERKRAEDSPFNKLKAALNYDSHVVDERVNAPVSLTSRTLCYLIEHPRKLSKFIQDEFMWTDGSRISLAHAKSFAMDVCVQFQPPVHRPLSPRGPAAHPSFARGTVAATHDGMLQVALTESELGLIHKPRPLPSIQLGDEILPVTHSHVSMLYWRLGLCETDKFEGLALGAELNTYIERLRTEEANTDPHILALISTSGSGKTRSLLELLCLRFGLLLVGDTYGNDGAADFARAVMCGEIDTNRRAFARQVAACVLARLLVLRHARAHCWTPAQFLIIQLFDDGLFQKIQLRLETALVGDLDPAIMQLLELLHINGLPIIMDEAQALLPDTPSGVSLYKVATGILAQYTNALATPAILIVSGTSFVLKDVQPHLASGLLKLTQTLPTMAPSPLTRDDVSCIVRKVLRREPPAAVGELLHGRGRFVMTFLREVLFAVEVTDDARGVVPRARAQPAPDDVRASKRARTAASGSVAGALVGAGAGTGAGAGAARVAPVPGYGDGSGDGGVGQVTVAKLGPRKWDTTVWLEHLANAERLILFGGRSIVGSLTEAVSRFNAKSTWSADNFSVMTALGEGAAAAALGAKHAFMPRTPSDAEWLLQFGLGLVRSINGEPKVVVYEPLVLRAILVVVLEQHADAFEDLLSTTMQLASAASASTLGFVYGLVQPSRWAAMFHGHLVDEVPLFNTWRPPCLPAGRSLGQVYNGRMEVVAVDDAFERTGYAKPFRGSIIQWLGRDCPRPVCLPPPEEGPDACMVIKLSSKDGNAVLHVLMFIHLKAMLAPLTGKELQHAKDTVIVGRMGKVNATAKKPGARGTDRAVALAKSVDVWAKANSGVVLGWLLCPLSSFPRSTEVTEKVDTQTLFNVDARALGKAAGSDAGGASCEVLVKGTMLEELTKWAELSFKYNG